MMTADPVAAERGPVEQTETTWASGVPLAPADGDFGHASTWRVSGDLASPVAGRFSMAFARGLRLSARKTGDVLAGPILGTAVPLLGQLLGPST